MKKWLKNYLIILGVLIILGGVMACLVKFGIISRLSNVDKNDEYKGCCSCCPDADRTIATCPEQVCCPCK